MELNNVLLYHKNTYPDLSNKRELLTLLAADSFRIALSHFTIHFPSSDRVTWRSWNICAQLCTSDGHIQQGFIWIDFTEVCTINRRDSWPMRGYCRTSIPYSSGSQRCPMSWLEGILPRRRQGARCWKCSETQLLLFTVPSQLYHYRQFFHRTKQNTNSIVLVYFANNSRILREFSSCY